jgi:hypothetical protein
MPPLSTTEGARAAYAWLRERRLGSSKPWFVEVALDVAERPVSVTYNGDTDTRFHLNVYPEEWGVFFCHGSRASWVRVTDQPFIHGRDDHDLMALGPELDKVGYLLHTLEQRYRVRFVREHALIRTNLVGGTKALRDWLATV